MSKRTRREWLCLVGVASAGIGGLAGCSSSGTEGTDSSPTDASQSTRTATLADENNTETPATTATETPSEQDLSFEHPEEVLVDEPLGMTINGLPANTAVNIHLGEPEQATTTATVKTDDEGQVDLSDANVVGGDVPTDLSVPLPVALLQFGDLPDTTGQTQSVTYGGSADSTGLGSTTVTRQLPPDKPDQELQRDEFV
ncbi:MAG: hypothetical protein J07HX5_02067, partial [halophilic archaeon J07HX5]